MGLLDIFRRKKSGTASPSTDSKRGDWRKWFLNREGLGGMKFNPDPGGYIDYSPFFQRGGSVNPHEETTRAARDWSPREQYISRSNQDRMHDATVNRFIQEGQSNQQRWEQGGGQGPYPVFNDPGADYSPPITQGWMEASSGRDNSGIMTADAGNLMNKYKQFTEKFGDFDIGRDGIEYEKDFDIPFGGTGTFKGYGGGDGYEAGINFNWPLGQSAALDEGIGSTDEYQMAKVYGSGDKGMQYDSWGGWGKTVLSDEANAINQALQFSRDPNARALQGFQPATLRGALGNKLYENNPEIYRGMLPPDIRNQLPEDAFETESDWLNQQPITVV